VNRLRDFIETALWAATWRRGDLAAFRRMDLAKRKIAKAYRVPPRMADTGNVYANAEAEREAWWRHLSSWLP
jgi:hypothetical protein